MKIKVKDLSKEHPAVLAARLMADEYDRNETLVPACEAVLKKFPDLTPEQVICLWLGVNAEERKSLPTDE
ncbi:hypothetical protein [Vibrio navarrensis]|uniref:hypothetical protein n=1 Tax=Vibrio navarrensis TaxID=29495 RepID=UPI00186A3566|nr:hypothetical protein [Vibrio navarrensis]MBE4621015.1 hypothetical protein [Vibrio navarrensis]